MSSPNNSISLDITNSSSIANRNLFIFFLVFLVYVLIVALGVSDMDLFVPDAQIHLPVINVEIPLFGFFIATPLMLIGFHVNLLINLKIHTEKLQLWIPGKLPTDRKKLYPFIVNFQHITTGVIKALSKGIVWTFYFPLPLFSFSVILFQFAPYHNYTISIFHLAAVFVDVVAIAYFSYPPINQRHSLSEKIWYIGKLFILGVLVSICIFQIYILGRIVIPDTPSAKHEIHSLFDKARILRFKRGDTGVSDKRFDNSSLSWIEELILWSSNLFWPVLDISNSDLIQSAPSPQMRASFRSSPPENENEIYLAYRGYNLTNRDFRYASFADSTLIGADFRNSKLDRANLARTKLQHANFRFASAKMTSFNGSDLRRAVFDKANFDGAKFLSVEAEEAMFGGSAVAADFRGANLNGSFFVHSTLPAADFSQATMNGVVVINAHLMGANFSDVTLVGSYFSRSNLQASNLQNAELSGSWISSSILKGIQRKKSVEGVKFSGSQFQNGPEGQPEKWLNEISASWIGQNRLQALRTRLEQGKQANQALQEGIERWKSKDKTLIRQYERSRLSIVCLSVSTAERYFWVASQVADQDKQLFQRGIEKLNSNNPGCPRVRSGLLSRAAHSRRELIRSLAADRTQY